MVGITEATAAFEAFKSMKELASAMVGVRDAAAFQAKAGELNAKIIEAQAAVFAAYEDRTALVERVRDLESQVASFEDWDSEKERYQLERVGQSGPMVYGLKPGMEPPEPQHQLCPTCYQRRKKSILQPEVRTPGMFRVLVCHSCNSDFLTSGVRPDNTAGKMRR